MYTIISYVVLGKKIAEKDPKPKYRALCPISPKITPQSVQNNINAECQNWNEILYAVVVDC